MNSYRQPIPIALTVVAVFFIIGGITSLIEVFIDLMYGKINLNFGVLGLFIGPGLFGLRPWARTLALVFTWIAMVFIPIIGLLMLANAGNITLSLFGIKMGNVSVIFALGAVVVAFIVCIWEYHVLTRPDVRVLFLGYPIDEE